jgi:exonuclease SbcC
LLQRRAELARRLAAGEAVKNERDTLEERRRALEGEFNRLHSENGRLTAQIAEWDKRLAELAKQKGVCIVCNSPLPAEKTLLIRAEYEDARRRCEDERKGLRERGREINREQQSVKERDALLSEQAAAADRDRGELAQIEKQCEELAAIKEGLPHLAAERDRLQAILDSGAYALDKSAQIAVLRQTLQTLATADADCKAARARLAALSGAERAYLDLQHSCRRLSEALAILARRQEKSLAVSQARADRQKQLAGAETIEKELIEASALIAQNSAEEERCRRDVDALNKEIGSHAQAISRCREQRARRGTIAEKLSQAKKDREAFDQLATAFGKKGVQALIIENAVPELQQEANRLLERLTDGDMSLFFETLREARNKKDPTIETLEIKVSDSLGTRPLEMFSGGEAFRVAFAIRIALSKLLAQRAGARLQTLIIDEGFGTQDAKGREKLVEAITAIGDEFRRIIVITHVEELKDAFPARIEVTKSQAGSQITLVEGGAG